MNDVWKMFNFFTDDEVLPVDKKSASISNIVTCNNLPTDFVPIFDGYASFIEIGSNKSDSIMLLDMQNDEICEAQNISVNKSEICNEVVETVQISKKSATKCYTQSSMIFDHVYCTNPNKKTKKRQMKKLCQNQFAKKTSVKRNENLLQAISTIVTNYLQWINSNSIDSIGRISKKEEMAINVATNSGDIKKLVTCLFDIPNVK